MIGVIFVDKHRLRISQYQGFKQDDESLRDTFLKPNPSLTIRSLRPSFAMEGEGKKNGDRIRATISLSG